MPHLKNQPHDFPYGDALKAVLDTVYDKAKKSLIPEHFQRSRAFEELSGGNESDAFVRCGSDIYNKKDFMDVLVALDIRDAGILLSIYSNPDHVRATERTQIYRDQLPEIQKVIQDNKLTNEDGMTLTVAEALEAYGKFRWEQIERGDARKHARDHGQGQGHIPSY